MQRPENRSVRRLLMFGAVLPINQGGRSMNQGLGIAEIKPHVLERRRFRRYHYSAPIFIRSRDGSEVRGITMEISGCGTSVMAAASLKVGDFVELEPIGGAVAKAIVRRTLGKLYGLEFLGLSLAQVKKIRKICKMLPVYRLKTLDLWQPATACSCTAAATLARCGSGWFFSASDSIFCSTEPDYCSGSSSVPHLRSPPQLFRISGLHAKSMDYSPTPP